MRIHWMMAALAVVTACSSAPSAPKATPATVVAAVPKGSAEATTVQEASKAGYRIVDLKGETVYCREQLKTGSHVRKETICLTAAELEAAREASRRNVSQMQRATPPPQGK